MRAKQIACVVLLGVISSVLVVVNILESDAQLDDPPAIRCQTNARGDIDSIGNTVMTCPASTACTGAQAGTRPNAVEDRSMSHLGLAERQPRVAA